MTNDYLIPLIKTALAEDIGSGDMTSQLLIADDARLHLAFVARAPMVVCGVEVPALVYARLDGDVVVKPYMQDGEAAKAGEVIATVSGNARTILTGERTALNLMQRMSGVATLTRQYVDAVACTKAQILDTRKTMPGMRLADKYAVRMGGGVNHRMGLYDAVMVKDNHLAQMKDEGLAIKDIVSVIKEKLVTHHSSLIPIYIECDTIAQLHEVLAAKPERIMLDNMPFEMLREAVRITAGSVPLEATGGVNLQTVRPIAETGVDFISVGAITHSATAVDIGLDVFNTPS